MSRGLRIAPGLKLDPDYVGGGTFGLLAKKGAGKSYLARVMAEEFWTAKVPFVLLDPMGTSWGLRSSADGEGEGIPVAIFGGNPDRADAPLKRESGAVIADLVVDEGLSMILDLSELGTRAAERQFAMDFFDRLYRRNKDLVHLLVDEADLFAPQNPQAGDKPLLGVTENIVRRGRNRGIGVTLITQRPAVLNKDVLTQVDGLVAMRITGLTDREAIDKWVAGHGDDPEQAQKVKATLAGLESGECWWWVPELGILKRVQVRTSRTFDSSPTKKRGAKAREPKSFADVDMGAIEKKMASTIERAKAEDPKALRQEIARLKKEKRKPAEPEVREVEKPVEVPVLANGAMEKLTEAVDAVRDVASKLDSVAQSISGELRKVSARPVAPRRRPVPERPRRGQARGSDSSTSSEAPKSEPSHDAGEIRLARPERAILAVLAQFTEGRTKPQLAILSGYSSKSSSFSNALGGLRSAGLISPAKVEPITITDEGLALAPDVEPVPTGEELYRYWLGRLGKAERAILAVLYEAYPDELDREEISERSGYSATSSSFSNALGKLRSLELVEGFRASDALFEGAPV